MAIGNRVIHMYNHQRFSAISYKTQSSTYHVESPSHFFFFFWWIINENSIENKNRPKYTGNVLWEKYNQETKLQCSLDQK